MKNSNSNSTPTTTKKNFFKTLLSNYTLQLTLVVTISTISQTNVSYAYPWDGFISKVKDELTGPLAQGLTVIAIAISGYAMTMGEHQGLTQKLIKVAFGASLAMGAIQLMDLIKSSAG
ncbi:MAG: TrbC/VirB2 family protein [Patescibacteria group bacterium]|jgi:type IV secretory pathway VirB2 component (pilin)